MAFCFAAWANEVPENGAKQVEFGETEILLARSGGRLHAVAARCPHAKAPLVQGAVCAGRVVCPWHMASFDLADGSLIEPPAMRGLDTYAIEVRGPELWVDPVLRERPRPTPPSGGDGRHFVLVGAGAAAAMAAETLREEGFAGRITVVDPDAAEPVDRTLLSKQALAGQWDMGKLGLWTRDDLERLRIDRVAGRVVELDAGQRSLRLEDGRAIGYDAALAAPGGRPVRLDVPGAGLPGVHTLRHAADCQAILTAARHSGHAVVIGTSFIGMEAAASLRDLGIAVTVLGTPGLPFARQFGDRVAAAILRLHRSKGVAFRLGAELAGIEGNGRAEAVLLRSGERIPAGVVVAGLGVRPATGFLRGVRLDDDGAIRVDRGLRAAPGLWAAGDAAAIADGPPRIEHWRLAQQHGRIAARNMLGQDVVWAGVPFFWSAQHGKRLDYLGHADSWDAEVIDGDLDAFDFIAWYLAGDRVAAMLSCGRESATALMVEALRRPLTLDDARAALRAMPAAG